MRKYKTNGFIAKKKGAALVTQNKNGNVVYAILNMFAFNL